METRLCVCFKDSCVRQANRCVRSAKLVALQLHFLNQGSDLRVINLRPAELLNAVTSLPRCYQVCFWTCFINSLRLETTSLGIATVSIRFTRLNVLSQESLQRELIYFFDLHTDSRLYPVLCLSGLCGVGGVQLQSRLGRDSVPEGDPERRLCLPGGAQTPPSAHLQPVRGHFQKVRQWEAARLQQEM